MNRHFEETAKLLYKKYHPEKIIEVAVNTGGILEHIGADVLGFEPASACWPILEKKGIPSRREFFSVRSARETEAVWGKADLVYCANTLRSLKDLRGFFEAVLIVLKDDGAFVVEDPYVIDIVNRNEWDQFYSENVFGFSVSSMQHIAKMFGMEVIDVDALPDNHGGSLRYHLARIGKRQISTSVESLKVANDEFKLKDKLNTFQQFIDDISTQFVIALTELKSDQGIVTGYGATAKSVTLLNYAGVGAELISQIYDTTPGKVGKYIPGVHIPIVNADYFGDVPNERAVVLFPYNHKSEIFGRDTGRKWLLYFPNVHYEKS
jgi:methylation protein EvaC